MRTQLFLALSLSMLPAALSAQEKVPAKDPSPAVVAVGKPAPAFRVNDHTGKATAVGGAAATWTVLAFYPKAATPG